MSESNVESSEDKKILLALAENGFDLEWRVGCALSELGFDVRRAVHGDAEAEDAPQVSSPETDIIAQRKVHDFKQSLLIECKGARAGSRLVLIESDITQIRIPRIFIGQNNINLTSENCYWAGLRHQHFPYTQAGDFFAPSAVQKRQSGFQLSGKDSNFYKATLQINNGFAANFDEFLNDGIGWPEVVPIIVTNAEIKLANLNEKSVRGVKWALTPSPVIFTSQSRIGKMQWSFLNNSEKRKMLPGLWVVNEASLNEFIEQHLIFN